MKFKHDLYLNESFSLPTLCLSFCLSVSLSIYSYARVCVSQYFRGICNIHTEPIYNRSWVNLEPPNLNMSEKLNAVHLLKNADPQIQENMQKCVGVG